MRAAGFDIANMAVQLIGDRPRLGSRRAEAELAMSEAVGAPVSLVGDDHRWPWPDRSW